MVVVGAFEESSEIAKSLGIGATARDVLSTILSRSRVFVVVERDKLDKLISELELQLSGITEGEAAEAGMLLNADSMIFGSVSEVAEHFLVTIRIVRLETGVSIPRRSASTSPCS